MKSRLRAAATNKMIELLTGIRPAKRIKNHRQHLKRLFAEVVDFTTLYNRSQRNSTSGR
jgi:hypothetical protein